MYPVKAISNIIDWWGEKTPDAPAVLSQHDLKISYRDLRRFTVETRSALAGNSLQPGDRIAIVLPNGHLMAMSFVAVSACAVSAPLNPAFREEEFEFYLRDLRARALVTLKGFETPARRIARQQGIPVLEISDASGTPEWLNAPKPGDEASNSLPFGDSKDECLVLHTSGTTSRPKLVPLTHANVCSSAANVAESLCLTDADLCLNVMPLFHIHGLIAALMSSLSSGGAVLCTGGFDAACFSGWLEAFRPTWYTSVPTIHQAILSGPAAGAGGELKTSLRLIRSSSASLAPRVMEQLESVFQVPVIEAYGMTEAAHQICSNPLPPHARKPGSVGRAAGPEIGILDDQGNIRAPGEVGEIAIRGNNVTPGYDRNPEANQAAFCHGWFRTGDQGRIDQDGYLFITGRIKEMINRGGENVSPREIDDVLLECPGVAQAVSFSVPHERLGEDVAAAVVLAPGEAATESQLRDFALSNLAPHKVPSQIVFVDQIPKGPTGKIQRIGLHDKLAAQMKAEYCAPEGPVECALMEVWQEVLQDDVAGTGDNFFFLGGDSLMATQVATRVRAMFGVELPVQEIFRSPTIQAQAVQVELLILEQVEHE